MTNAELLALLREARNALSQGCWNGSCCGVRTRIDAALAEGCPDCGHQYGQQEYCQGDGHAQHADSATPVVEWVNAERDAAFKRGVNAAAKELDRLLTERKATAIWVGPDELRAIAGPKPKGDK